MYRALLGLTAMSAVVVPASPAFSQNQNAAAATAFSAMAGTSRIFEQAPPARFGRTDLVRSHRRHIRVGVGVALYGGYNDYGDYDANRSFDPDKWNDWWHERPERAFPRWMNRNLGCERPWYSGDVLTC